jgi:hypothetical protein
LKIQIDDLEFNSDYFYIQSNTIVEKIIFNNRTFYSKYEKIETHLTQELIEQHKKDELTLALPLIEKEIVNYLVIEYYQEDWQSFYSLIKHLFKTLNITDYKAYKNPNKELLQIFISHPNTPLEIAYEEIDKIKQTLELKSKKSYRIFPNKNSPKNYNIITFPLNIV